MHSRRYIDYVSKFTATVAIGNKQLNLGFVKESIALLFLDEETIENHKFINFQ